VVRDSGPADPGTTAKYALDAVRFLILATLGVAT
jgi:hypothetical protein